MRSPEDGAGARIVDSLLNRGGPPGLRTRASVTFGSPWLEPVLRGVTAAEEALASCDADDRPAIREALDVLWGAAVAGQSLHRDAAADAHLTPAVARRHAHLVELAEELELHAAERCRRRTGAVSADAAVVEQIERLRSLRLAQGELDGSSAERALQD